MSSVERRRAVLPVHKRLIASGSFAASPLEGLRVFPGPALYGSEQTRPLLRIDPDLGDPNSAFEP